MPTHPLYRGRGSLLGARRVCRPCNLKAMEGHPEWIGKSMQFDADEFNAQVYRGKPFTELGYAERAVLQHKMLEAAEIEQAIINLEAAVRMGLITEDEVMRSLVERFGA